MSVCTRKDGTIFVNWVEGGKDKRKYFGRGVQAMAEAMRYNARITSPVGSVAEQGPVFTELVNEYLAAKVSSMKPASMSALIYKMRSVILPEIGNMVASRINHTTLDKFVAKRGQSVKMTTAHRDLCDIRAVLNFAVKRRIIAVNPVAGYEMPKRDDTIVMPLAREEIEAIIAHSAEHLRRAILLSFFTGLRPGAVELLSIRYSQINWTAMSITIISARKGGILQREVPIHPGLPLQQWFAEDGSDQDRHVITWKGLPVKNIRHAWERAKVRAGVGNRKIPMYALRHAFVTTLLHLGVDIRTIADISGHDVNTMLKHYAHTMSASRQAAIDKLPGIMHPLGAEIEEKLKFQNE